ncbi:hypothetical protein DFJ74DRAFT_646499 [Hyaloraphidium curvatum]|nr:hypothetical protein DFJ74DRAFT_646499 [Hyaloraphidium curvatum]
MPGGSVEHTSHSSRGIRSSSILQQLLLRALQKAPFPDKADLEDPTLTWEAREGMVNHRDYRFTWPKIANSDAKIANALTVFIRACALANPPLPAAQPEDDEGPQEDSEEHAKRFWDEVASKQLKRGKAVRPVPIRTKVVDSPVKLSARNLEHLIIRPLSRERGGLVQGVPSRDIVDFREHLYKRTESDLLEGDSQEPDVEQTEADDLVPTGTMTSCEFFSNLMAMRFFVPNSQIVEVEIGEGRTVRKRILVRQRGRWYLVLAFNMSTDGFVMYLHLWLSAWHDPEHRFRLVIPGNPPITPESRGHLLRFTPKGHIFPSPELALASGGGGSIGNMGAVVIRPEDAKLRGSTMNDADRTPIEGPFRDTVGVDIGGHHAAEIRYRPVEMERSVALKISLKFIEECDAGEEDLVLFQLLMAAFNEAADLMGVPRADSYEREVELAGMGLLLLSEDFHKLEVAREVRKRIRALHRQSGAYISNRQLAEFSGRARYDRFNAILLASVPDQRRPGLTLQQILDAFKSTTRRLFPKQAGAAPSLFHGELSELDVAHQAYNSREAKKAKFDLMRTIDRNKQKEARLWEGSTFVETDMVDRDYKLAYNQTQLRQYRHGVLHPKPHMRFTDSQPAREPRRALELAMFRPSEPDRRKPNVRQHTDPYFGDILSEPGPKEVLYQPLHNNPNGPALAKIVYVGKAGYPHPGGYLSVDQAEVAHIVATHGHLTLRTDERGTSSLDTSFHRPNASYLDINHPDSHTFNSITRESHEENALSKLRFSETTCGHEGTKFRRRHDPGGNRLLPYCITQTGDAFRRFKSYRYDAEGLLLAGEHVAGCPRRAANGFGPVRATQRLLAGHRQRPNDPPGVLQRHLDPIGSCCRRIMQRTKQIEALPEEEREHKEVYADDEQRRHAVHGRDAIGANDNGFVGDSYLRYEGQRHEFNIRPGYVFDPPAFP